MQAISPYRQAADAVARTCCFVAVLSIPLYFSLLTTTGYEPDKAVLLRVLAVLAGAGWLAGEIAQPGRVRLGAAPRLIWASLALFAAVVIATILSIDPRLSFWGSAVRQEGLVTWAAYLVFLVVAVTRLRSRQDWRTLISAVLLGSMVVAVYGYLQQLGLDPVPASGDPNTLAWPVRSTLGQHVFLGSYLVMVIPFSLARFLEGSNAVDTAVPADDSWRPLLAAAAMIAGMVVSFFAITTLGVARAPVFAIFPGVLAAYGGLVILLERLPRSRRLAVATHWAYGALTLMLISTLAVSGARGAWLGALTALPVFGFLVARKQGRAGPARVILWTSAAAALALVLLNIPNGPLQPLRSIHGLSRVANIADSGGEGGSAQGRLLLWQGVGNLMTSTPADGGTWGGPARDLVGYGPESLHWAFQTVFPLQLRRVTSEIWTWDRSHDIYLDLLVDAGLLGLVTFLAVLVLFFRRVQQRLASVGDEGSPTRGGTVHRGMEGAYVPRQPASGSLRWMRSGGVALRRASLRPEVVPGGTISVAASVPTRPGMPSLPHDARVNRERERAPGAARNVMLAGRQDDLSWTLVAMGAAVAGHLVDGIFGLETPVTLLLTWLFVGLLAQPGSPRADLESAGTPPSKLRQYGLLWLGLAIAAAALVFVPPAISPTLLVAVWLLGIVAAVRSVTTVMGIETPPRAKLRTSRTSVALVIAALLTLGALLTQMRYEGAAIAERAGLAALGQNTLPAAIGDLQYASSESPFEPQYRTELAGAYLSLGANHLDSADPAYIPSSRDITSIDPAAASGFSRDQLFALAAFTLQSARDLSPLDPDAYGNLGNLYLEWNRASQAAAYFREAEALSHQNPRYIDQEALADLQLGRLQAARSLAARAFALDGTFWYSYYTQALIDHRIGAHAASRQAAASALLWVKNYWPSPPQGQIQELHLLAKSG